MNQADNAVRVVARRGKGRQSMAAGIRVLLASALLTLAGCAQPVRIGDATQALMPPGTGLLATTVVVSNPRQPSFMKLRGTLFQFRYRPTDGKNKDDIVVSSRGSAVLYSAVARAMKDDAAPVLLLTPAKPGKYRLSEASTDANGRSFRLHLPVTPEVEVTAGEVTYVGSMLLRYTTSWKGPDLVANAFSLHIKDDFSGDLAELRAHDHRLRTVVAKSALGR